MDEESLTCVSNGRGIAGKQGGGRLPRGATPESHCGNHFCQRSGPLQKGPPFFLSSSAPRCFDGGDVDLFHGHHRLEGTLGGRVVGIGGCVQ